MKLDNIGIALSGGGIRATIFHLGVFKWLAENKLFEEIRRISSVSGGSLCVGMIFAHNNLRWPTSEEFIDEVLPSIEKVLLTSDLQLSALRRLITSPRYWNRKVNLVAKLLEEKWGICGNLSDVTGNVTWYLNCTTYETGKRFRFCRENMGDYTIGFVDNPDISLSDAMAASAGFPALIGPYSLQTSNYSWKSSCYRNEGQKLSTKKIHLWDGGVYDNLGLESIFKPDNGGALRDDLEFMFVSNASPSIDLYHRKVGLSAHNLKRLLDISMDQVTSLRTRMVMEFIKRTNKGVYIKIGNSTEKITSVSKCEDDLKQLLINKCLSDAQVKQVVQYPTTLRKPSERDYQVILRHGFEVTDCTYRCYQK